MSDIRLLVLDIDGTIAGESNQIREPVKQAIKAAQNKGIQVTLATGRMYCGAVNFHQDISSELPLIAYNGALIQSPITGEIYQHLPLASEIALELLTYFEQPRWRDRFGVHLYRDDQLYVKEITQETEIYAQRTKTEAIVIKDWRSLLTSPITKMVALAEEAGHTTEVILELKQRYSSEIVHLTQSSDELFEANNPLATKGTAIKYLTEKILGLKPENVMAIGDNYNDVEMLDYVGVGVAMGTAPEGVKMLGDWVAPGVEEDGVAIAIEKFLLKD